MTTVLELQEWPKTKPNHRRPPRDCPHKNQKNVLSLLTIEDKTIKREEPRRKDAK
jgi:hypothetical protein